MTTQEARALMVISLLGDKIPAKEMEDRNLIDMEAARSLMAKRSIWTMSKSGKAWYVVSDNGEWIMGKIENLFEIV